jgi:hypothetical protein
MGLPVPSLCDSHAVVLRLVPLSSGLFPRGGRVRANPLTTLPNAPLEASTRSSTTRTRRARTGLPRQSRTPCCRRWSTRILQTVCGRTTEAVMSRCSGARREKMRIPRCSDCSRLPLRSRAPRLRPCGWNRNRLLGFPRSPTVEYASTHDHAGIARPRDRHRRTDRSTSHADCHRPAATYSDARIPADPVAGPVTDATFSSDPDDGAATHPVTDSCASSCPDQSAFGRSNTADHRGLAGVP